ncbi:MAG TPA: VRR-NUC domain-containing protein [Gaiellaceae bacterium]|nr:VRR-NUC domain-containing protein [Gaiellaceae bacterium]
MSEEQLLQAITEAATYAGWRWVHFRPARTEKGWRTPTQGHSGFPDLCLARNGKVLFLELKRLGKYATPEQEEWIRAINGPEVIHAAKVQAYQVNTSQLDVVLAMLR